MLCERCKVNEANIVIREVVNGVVKEHNLCAACARETELSQMFDDFPFGKLLSGILGLNSGDQEDTPDEYASIVCQNCGMSYGEFVKNSQFGCKECYDTFRILMNDNIKKLQGSDTYVGKHPRYQTDSKPIPFFENKEEPAESVSEQLEVLKSRLREALAEENYEQAAHFRDQIRELQQREGIDA